MQKLQIAAYRGFESHPLRQKSVILRVDDPPHG